MSLVPTLDLRRQSITADAWGRYYTSSRVSSALVDAMGSVRPKLILELGVGQGALASAAYKKWNSAKYVTVDTDHCAMAAIKGFASLASHTHHVHDALDDELADQIGISLGSVDVGLCNPPYVRPRWRASFGRILEEAGLSSALQSVHDAGADLLFIAQNLRLLKRQGKLGLILPDGLMTGEKYRGAREVLLRQHRIDLVVQLPRKVFSRTEAQTYLLVLSKRGGETQSVALSRMSEDGTLTVPILVPADVARVRLDYAFHAVRTSPARPFDGQTINRTIGSLLTDIFRGAINSSQIDACRLPVFHLGDFPASTSSLKGATVPARFIQPISKLSELHESIKVARAGDILIARIGRNLQEKVCFLQRGFCVISDCVFALRAAPEDREVLLSYLRSEAGQINLAAVSHGVGANYISRADVMNILLPA